jgi:membrane-bound serine protease (ClpP class)
MDILLDPNVVYLLLVVGLVFAVLAMVSPGTGVIEILALFVLLLAGWSIVNLAGENQINWWGLGAIVVGVLLFIVAVYRFGHLIMLGISILIMVVGSAYLFRSLIWYTPGVNPILAASVGIVTGGFFWVAARKAIEAGEVRPTHDLEGLIGQTGEAKSLIHQEGSVQVAGELWSAESDEPILEGTRVRVVGREGFVLKVEKIKQAEA